MKAGDEGRRNDVGERPCFDAAAILVSQREIDAREEVKQR